MSKREYLLQHLPRHLNRTGDKSKLEEILTDLDFICKKTFEHFTNSLVADTELATVQNSPTIMLLGELLKRFSHLFDRCEEEQELLNSLIVRLFPYDQFKTTISKHVLKGDHLILLPVRPLPDQGSPYELRKITHNAGIRDLIFDQKREILYSANREPLVRAWDIKTGQEKFNLMGHEKALTCLAYLPLSDRLITGSEDHKLILWDLESQKEVYTSDENKGEIFDLATNVNETRLLSITTDGTLLCWSLDDFEHLGCMSFQSKPTSVCFLETDDRCAVGLSDGQVLIVNLNNYSIIQKAHIHHSQINTILFEPTHKWVITGSQDGIITLSNTSNLSKVRSFNRHESGVLDLALSSTNNLLASVGEDELVLLWNLENLELFAGLTGHSAPYNGGLPAVDFHPDGNILASGSVHESIQLWNVPKEPLLKFTKPMHGYYCAFHPQTNFLQTANSDIQFWDPKIWEVKMTIPGEKFKGTTCDISPDGKIIWLGGSDGLLHQLTNPALESISTIKAHDMRINHVAVSENYISTVSDDNQVKVWNARSNELVYKFQGHTADVFFCAISPDEKMLVSVGLDKEMRVWSLELGKQTHKLEGHQADIVRCRFSPSGCRMLTASHDGSVNLWDTNTWEIINSYQEHLAWVNDAVFSPSEQLAASASQDETIRVWDVRTGETKAIVRLDGWLEGLAWHPDGRTISAIGQQGLFVFRIG